MPGTGLFVSDQVVQKSDTEREPMPEMSRMKGPWSRRGDESEWQGGLQMLVRGHLPRERGRARG